MKEHLHSVTLDKDKCCGCTNCIKRCPTEAIRVRDGKARIISERCIDCGECIRVCPHHAKKAISDKMSVLKNWECTIALPPPALFGQFNNLDDLDIVLTGLKKIGFDYVYEVPRGAELVSDATRIVMENEKLEPPVISSACPAVTRLIAIRFPDLVENVLPLKAPIEVAAMMAKKKVSEETGLPLNKIGAFFISPCPAKVTDINNPIGNKSSWLDGAISVSTIYPLLVEAMDKLSPQEIETIALSGVIGVSWGSSGGEAAATLTDKYLAADGIENVIHVLEELESGRINDVNFLELNACSGGCVGGVLNVENAYVAQARLHRLRKYLPVSQNHMGVNAVQLLDHMRWTKKLQFSPVMNLSNNLEEAMTMMSEMESIKAHFPNLDCGSCGAPSCRAMAEDVVKGDAKESDCIFVLREQVKDVADMLSSIGGGSVFGKGDKKL